MSIPHFGVQECMGHRDLANEVFKVSYTFADGYPHPGDSPGLGVELKEEAAAAYPYDPRYRPVNRRLDGTVHDW